MLGFGRREERLVEENVGIRVDVTKLFAAAEEGAGVDGLIDRFALSSSVD